MIVQHIPLTLGSDCWVNVTTLSKKLLDYVDQHFDTWFTPPEKRASVVMSECGNKVDVEVHRWQQSYGATPKFDPEVAGSFMFRGMDQSDESCQGAIPDHFLPLKEFVEAQLGRAYNQAVVNWYADGSDYIAMHSDYECCMAPDSDVTIINLVKSDEVPRYFLIKSKKPHMRSMIDTLKLPLLRGMVITMGGNTQSMFYHGVPKVHNGEPGPRISLTLRHYDE